MVDLDAWLPRAAALRPAHPALVTSAGATTYAELHGAARDAAAALAAAGVGEGDRVALALAPGLPFVAALHATLLLGAAAVPLDLRLAEEELARRAEGATVVVGEPPGAAAEASGAPRSGAVAPAGASAAGAAAEALGSPRAGTSAPAVLTSLARPPGAPDPPLLERFDPDAVATVLFTSGTTAAPKPVELTIGNWAWNALGSALALGLDPADRWLCTLPLAHVGGLSILIRSAVYGTTVVLHERFDAARAAQAIAQEGITLASLVPTTLQRVLDAGLDGPQRPRGRRLGAGPSLERLRVALIGGGPLAPALAARAAAAGIPTAQTYGMTEACSQVTTSLPGEPETAGRALVGQQVALSPDGEILVRGATVARAALSPDGWLRTGDLGSLDARGRLTVTGRRADTIVSGGENVAPQEVEAVLLAHPAVADAGVHGRADDAWGEAVVATVVLREGARASAEELQAHVAAHLARFKVPKHVAFAAALPRTVSGKLLRRELE